MTLKTKKREMQPNSPMTKASYLLSEIQELIRKWAGNQPVSEIATNPGVAKSLEMVEQGARLIRAGIEMGEAR